MGFLPHRCYVVAAVCLLIAAHTRALGPPATTAPARDSGRLVIARRSSGKANAASRSNENLSTLCIEAKSALTVSEHNATAPRPPASMVKMMHFLLVAEGLRDGTWTLDTPITASENVAVEGTGVALKEGEVFTLGQLILAMAVVSANDAAVAVAEGLWGSQQACLRKMNERAAELGMTQTTFRTVHGLPPEEGGEPDITTARDMAILAQHCVSEPIIRKWVGRKEIQFRPDDPPRPSTNKLLLRMEDCDGLKTGYTRAAGFCLTATAERDNIRLIAVVMGAENVSARFDIAQQLLEESFAQVCRKRLLARGEVLPTAVPVSNCRESEIRLVAGDDLWVVVKNGDANNLKMVSEYPRLIQAPLPAGTALGEVQVQLAGETLGCVPLVLPSSLKEAGLRWKLIRSTCP